jgi:serine protease Do
MLIPRIVSVLFLTLLLSVTAFANLPNNNPSIAPMLKKAMPAVVNIRADIKITDFNMLAQLQKQKAQDPNLEIPSTYLSVGSGVIIDADKGYIITNAHVVNEAQTIAITLGDGRHFTAKLIGIDKASDIAVLKIKAKNLTALPMINSSNLKVGDFVAAIGNPFGLSQSVTTGIVSALGRTTLGIETYENFIQTDAPINPGNSGGALIDIDGNLIGINTAILAPNQGSIGIGFAIPSNMVKSIVTQLLQYGNVKRGMLGVAAQDITPDLADAFHLKDTKGAALTLIKAGSPAQKAGLEVGDILLAINDDEIHNANDVSNYVGFLRVDSKVALKVLRNNKPLTVHAVLSDPKVISEASAAIDPFLYGVALKNFSLLSPAHCPIKGVLVVSVDPDTHAWQADLRTGDVITSANQQKVMNVQELQKVAAAATNTLVLNVLRGAGAVFLVINKDPA